MTVRPYPAYRPSGAEWLGAIPSHWSVGRLKFSAASRPSNVDKHTKDDELPIRLCNYVDVYKNEYITVQLEFMQASATTAEITKFSLKKGDVLITKDSESWDDIAVPAAVKDDLEDVLCGYHLAMVRSDPGQFDSGYLFRLFCSEMLNYQFRISANGVTRFGLPASAIDNALIIHPPLDEQITISEFIDYETARIDAAISKRRRLLELTEENRLAVITHAVTRGLNRSITMRNSGIEWLGNIPSHWEIKVLKRIAKRIDVGIAEAATHAYVDVGVPIIRTTNVAADYIDTNDIRHIDERFAEKNRSKYLYAGDLLTVRTGVPGTTAVVPTELNGSQCFTMLMTTLDTGMVPEYFSAFLNSQAARGYFDAESWGTAQSNISVPILGSLPVIVPPQAEQQEIAKFVLAVTKKSARIIATMASSIELLQEYRSALITNAVTGKIDVRGFARERAAA